MNKIRMIINIILKQFEINNPKIIVFGAGNNSISISNILISNEGKVDCFCDNDKNKHNKYINNIKCINLEELNKLYS